MNNRKIDINPEVGKGGKLLSALLVVAVVVLTITFSIGLPIYVRPFYYAHIEALDMVAKMSGWKDWRSINVDDEMHARELISLEKRHKHNSLEDEYKRYLRLHK